MHSTRKYRAVFSVAMIHAIKNYKAFVGLSIFLLACMVIFSNLWKIAASKVGVTDLDPDNLLWYIAFNEWVLISIPSLADDMEDDLRSGRLAYLLPRPISYVASVCAEAMGTLVVNLTVLGIVTFVFAFAVVGHLPFHPLALIPCIIFGLLAGILAIIFQMIIGLSAFWFQDIEPFTWIWEKLLFMFGGLILPLSVYPGWMQTIAQFTPFPLILGGRSALALDFSFNNISWLLFSQLGWISLGTLFVLFLYRRGLRILNIEGG